MLAPTITNKDQAKSRLSNAPKTCRKAHLSWRVEQRYWARSSLTNLTQHIRISITRETKIQILYRILQKAMLLVQTPIQQSIAFCHTKDMEKISKFQNYLKSCKTNSLEMLRLKIWLQRSPPSGLPRPQALGALSTKSRSSSMTFIKRKWNTAITDNTSKRIIFWPSRLFLIYQSLMPWNKKVIFSEKVKAQGAWESCKPIRAYRMC